MKNISMRTECGFLARTVGNRPSFNRGQGNTTSDVEEDIGFSLIQMKNEADVSKSDKKYQRLLNNHVTQDSRCQSLPNCVENKDDKNVETATCDLGPRSRLCQPETNCDLMPSVCDKRNDEVKFDINGTVSTDSWFKTWPETRNIINTQTQKVVPHNSESPRKSFRQQSCDENRNCESNIPLTSNTRPSTAIPLDQLLQSIPLAYSPITRQLHVLSPPAHSESQQQDASKLMKSEEGEESLGCVLKSGSPFSSLSSLSGAEFCGPSTPSNDDDSSDTTSTSLVNDSHLNKNLLGTKIKQGTFSNFFSRGLFNWKLNKTGCESDVVSCDDRSSSSSSYAWKLFNRSGSAHTKEDALSLDEACSSASSSCSSISHIARFPSLEASSGALILEPRPSHLPAKSQEEELRHQLQYQQMVQAAKKKELKEAKLRKKQLQQQLKAEDQLAQAARIWSSEILPKWESMKGSRKARDLWWQGLPPCVRGKVWRLAVGNELNLTPDLYEICVARAQERLRAVETNCDSQDGKHGDEIHNPDKESSVELIQLDIARTFPLLCIFQKGGPYYDVLHSLLGAYVCYRPDVGYIQGMSFIAAVLILNLEVAEAFVCFANLLNRPCQRAFFHLDEPIMHAYYAAYDEVFQESLPRLHKHFGEQGLTPDLYLLDWLYTMFSRSMPLDIACRVWDVYLRDGEEFLFRAALGVMHLYQDILITLDFLHGAQFLNKLPDDISSEALFRSIEGIRMSVGKMKFGDVLTHKIELAKAEALDSN